MESTQEPVTVYVIMTTVVDIREIFVQRHVSGAGPDTVFESRSLGWFLFLDGSNEGLHLGSSRPSLKVGDRVKISLEPTGHTCLH